MHEFGITSRIMGVLLKVAEENNAKKVVKVDMLVGQLTFLNIRQVKMCYEILVRGTVLEGSELCVEESPGTICCRHCNHQREVQVNLPDDPKASLDGIPSFACSQCDGKVDIIKGKECQVTGIAFEN